MFHLWLRHLTSYFYYVSSLFGKRSKSALGGRLARVPSRAAYRENKVRLEFILSHAIGDERPYLSVPILVKNFLVSLILELLALSWVILVSVF